ncbi:MAG: ATP-binding protein [Candidatus Zixiibacteriota bacterium]
MAISRLQVRIWVLAGVIALTVGIHYGWVLERIFGHSDWVHSVHGRFCYIPILIGAAWFGVRGGLICAAAISALILPYLFGFAGHHMMELSDELVEVVFYFGIGGLVGFLVDREVLIRKKQETTQLELERSQHMSQVGKMAASVAHEIKNPLASIKGATEILLDDRISTEERSEFQGIVGREIKRIDSTVQEFLEFARPRDTVLAKLDLSEVIDRGLKQLAVQGATRGISFQSAIQEKVIVRGDGEKLHQLFLNLVLNAMQASPDNSTVAVLLRRIEPGRAELIVKDQGKGIPKEERDKVFEPFYTTKSAGTGLGLTIVKSIVTSHRGEISLLSEANQGTQVTVRIPLWDGNK